MKLDSARNRLLVSVPDTGDPNFDQSVVYVIDHDDAGAIGVVLNRPGTVTVPESVDVGIPPASPSVLFEGGPVSPAALVLLGRRTLGVTPKGLAEVGGSIGVLTASAVEERSIEGVDVIRVFAGYSGWAPGQLEGELDRGSWVMSEALPDDVFCSDPSGLWETVLARRGGRFTAMSRFPDDPSVN